MICPYCHHKIDDEAAFCPKCGHSLGGATSAAPAKKPHVKAIAIVAIVVAAVCLAGGAAWWRYDQQQKAAEEAAAGEAKAGEDAEAARHITAQTFQLDLPACWDGRVEVTVEGDTVTVYSKEYSNMAVCSIEGKDGPAEAMGDIGSGCIADIELGGGKYAEVWAKRWGWIYADQQNMREKPSTYYSEESVSELIDLQSGGGCTLADIQADPLCADSVLLDLIKSSIRAL